MANIFQNIWEKIKSIPEQYKAAGQILTELHKPSQLTGALRRLGSDIRQSVQSNTTVKAPSAVGAATDIPYNPEFSHNPYTGQYESNYGTILTQEQVQKSPYYQPAVTTAGGQTSIYSPLPSQPPSTQFTAEKYVAPPQAPSGKSGFSYQQQYPAVSGYGYSYVPYQAPSGVSGTASHTGLLGGVTAGLGISAPPTTEEKNKDITVQNKGAYINPLTQQSVPYGTASQGYTAQGQPITPPPTTQGNQGNQTNWNQIQQQAGMLLKQQGGSPNIAQTGIQGLQGTTSLSKGLGLPSFTTDNGALDLGAVQTGLNQIKNLLKSPLTEQSKSDMISYLQKAKDALLAEQKILNPLPTEPIIKPEALTDDPIQLDKLYAIEKQVYEDTQRALGIPQIITDYENAIKELQASDQAFNALIKEVNEDPDFPKGLARRRIQAIQKEQGVQTQALQNKIQLLQTSLQLKQQEFTDRMGITQRAISRQATAQQQSLDNARNQVQQFISSGAIATMSDADLQQLATAGGYTLSSLQQIRDSVARQAKSYSNIITKENANGDVTVIGITPSGETKILSTLKGVGTPSTSTSKTFKTPTNNDVQGFMNWFEKLRATGGATPDNWTMIKNSWVQNGFNPTLFDSYFATYKPKTGSSGLSIDDIYNNL